MTPAARRRDRGRVARAREDERRRQRKDEGARGGARKALGAIVEALAVSARLGSAMTDFFGVGALAEVAAKLEDCRRRDVLSDDVGRETAAISRSISQTRSRRRARPCETADRTALDEELSALKAREADDEEAQPRELRRLPRGQAAARRGRRRRRCRAASRRSGAPFWKRSRTGRGAISRCARASRRRTRRCVSIATAIAER